MLIYGASGHGKVIRDCIEANGDVVENFIDDDPDKTKFEGYTVKIGYDQHYLPEKKLIIGVGYNDVRKVIAGKIKHRFATVLHPSAIISKSAKIQEGTVVFHGAIIQTSALIGKHCIVNTGATIDHDCILEDFVHLAPNATLCGGVSVGEQTLIGAGSVVIPNVKIGKACFVGAGSVVVRDVPDNSVIAGNPARPIR